MSLPQLSKLRLVLSFVRAMPTVRAIPMVCAIPMACAVSVLLVSSAFAFPTNQMAEKNTELYREVKTQMSTLLKSGEVSLISLHEETYSNAVVGTKAAPQVQQNLLKADNSTLISFERYCGDGDFADAVYIDTVKDTVKVGFLCLDDEAKRSTMRFDFVFTKTNQNDLVENLKPENLQGLVRYKSTFLTSDKKLVIANKKTTSENVRRVSRTIFAISVATIVSSRLAGQGASRLYDGRKDRYLHAAVDGRYTIVSSALLYYLFDMSAEDALLYGAAIGAAVGVLEEVKDQYNYRNLPYSTMDDSRKDLIADGMGVAAAYLGFALVWKLDLL